MTRFLVLSQGLQDIYSSKGQYSCRALLIQSGRRHSPTPLPRGPSSQPGTPSRLLPFSTLHSGGRRAGAGMCIPPPRLFSLRGPTALPCSLEHSPFFRIPQIRTCTIQKFRLRLGTHTPDSISQGPTRSGWLPRFRI